MTVTEKVTALITRPSLNGHDLLLFAHPFAGVQIPAGTVEVGETAQQAVLREVAEETGLTLELGCQYLGCTEEKLGQGQRVIAKPTTVYARPDATSFDWAHLPTGISVAIERRENGFTQIKLIEYDRVPDPQYVSMCIVGWVPDDTLADTRRRHFFHLVFEGESQERWTIQTDNHTFGLFWSPIGALPEIIYPQNLWLRFLPKNLQESV
jgi:8-oxo-dGTP pyrophosphatase MutT (NUDIX family)